MNHLGLPAVREQLLERVSRLRPDTRAHWGRMNAHQMLCHLTDSFRVCLGEKDVTPDTGPLQRTVVKWLALYLPARWPKSIPTRPEVEQGVGGTCPGNFSEDRADLMAMIQRFSGSCDRTRHPIFGRMTERDWMRWAYLHVDHHLRQFGL